ncbi:MAG: hypothetical protein ACKVLE_05020 [Fidelibacterota bacterium]|jgi:hypothetical protein|tara:strand:- start:2736 stop:2993 length:258 start_codon:yes stop_codon:yes gene_type:complete
MKNIDPKRYSLSSRTILRQIGKNNISIIIDRKSRIIMKDGQRIMKQARAIHQINSNMIITVLTSAPVCSKTRSFLLEKNIYIKEL